MANVFAHNGANAIVAATLGNILSLNTIRVTRKNVTWTEGDGTLFSQAGDSSTSRELSAFAASGIFNIYVGGESNPLGDFTTIFGTQGIVDALFDFELDLLTGACTVKIDGVTKVSENLTVGSSRIDGCLFRLGARANTNTAGASGSEWFLPSGSKAGDTDVYLDGVLDRSYRKTTLTGTDWPETTNSQDGTVIGTASWEDPDAIPPDVNLTITKLGEAQSYPYNVNGTAVNCQVTFAIDAVDNIERSIDGGAFSTVISNAAIGEHTDIIPLTAGVYSVTYRMASDASASDTHILVVGYCLGVGGHSNVSGRGDNNQIVVPSTSGVTAYIFKNNDQFAVLTDPSDNSSGQVDSITDDGSLPGGSMLPHVANIWLEQNPDIPIIFNVNAKGGSQLSFWLKDSTEVADGLNRYDSLSRRVTKAGGINDLLFFIGGNDTVENRASYTQEKANLIQFASDIKTDFGANTLLIPLPDYTDKVNRPINDVVYGQDAIRMALQDAALESNNIYVTESIYAVGVGSDGVHSTSDQQLTDLGRITGRGLWHLDTQCAVSIPELDSSDGVFTVVGTNGSTEVLNERMFLTNGIGGTPAFNLDAGDPIELVLDNGTDTYTVSGQVGGTLAVATANTPPTANAGPDQSVAAGATVQLDASSSTPGTNPIALYEWTQTAGDTVALEDETTATPSFSAPSTTIAQTITFSVIAIDSEGNRSAAATVSVDVAAVVLSEILKIIERLDFELQTQGDVNAYYGRANREVMKLKPSNTEGLVMDGEFLNLESNTITEVKIVAEGVSISSKTDAININKSELIPRLGDLDIGKNGNIYFSIIVFVEGDDKGVVVSSKGATGNKPMIYVTL